MTDIEQVVLSPVIPWKDMENTTILITGATGLIGSVLVRVLSAVNAKYGINVRIIAHGRNSTKGGVLSEDCGVEFVSGDIRKPLTSIGIMADRIDYILHCAAVTTSVDMVAKPLDVIDTAIHGVWNVLELAKEKQSKSVVNLSSMEIYGQTSLREVIESDLGYLDLENPRSCYPESKRMCECLCNSYFTQYGLPVKTARLAQTFGAGTPQSDPRVFAQFARSAIAGKDIILHTEGKARGNYCYISDAVIGLILLLLKGENGKAYNIANPVASMTIREMAELVANKICNGMVSVIVDKPADIEKRGYAPDVNMRLNVDKIKQIGWNPRYGLEEMYTRMITDWRENNEKVSTKENT